MKEPKVTVLMPVHNASRYLAEAIESILNQSFKDFEYLIIDDGSTDDSLKIINHYAPKDSRIRVISRANKGLVHTLNEGLAGARGQYIARMDADDISQRNRLQKEVHFLDKHPKVGMVGSNFEHIDENGRKTGITTNVFTHHDDLKLAMICSNQFGHGTVMVRKKLITDQFFNADYKHAEDYDLWTRLSHSTMLANLKDPLYQWRIHGSGVTALEAKSMNEQRFRIIKREFNYYLKNKGNYRFWSFQPFSTLRGPIPYLKKKNTQFRDLSLLYCYVGYRRLGAPVLLVGILYAPWVLKTYKQLLITLFYKSRLKDIEFEML